MPKPTVSRFKEQLEHVLHVRSRSLSESCRSWSSREFITGSGLNDGNSGSLYVDLKIRFIGASELPRMDVVGSTDPYFVAKLGGKISFVSSVKPDTLSPVWDESWHIKNVPSEANLTVEVLDKDNKSLHDGYIGRFCTNIKPGTQKNNIEGFLLKRHHGLFWLQIESTPSTHPDPQNVLYVFDGPIRFSCHSSPTVGFFTKLGDTRLYSTWKMYIKGVRLYFGKEVQHWNRDYKAAQKIFGSRTLRATIQIGHKMLYSRSTTNAFGIIESVDGTLQIFRTGVPSNHGELFLHRVKPAVYTYIISAEDESFRFSETGAAFFVDFASKHALHANCAEVVRYAGEFHLRPRGGWQAFHDDRLDHEVEWELVVDNNSGTYSPNPSLLPTVKACLEYNFPGFTIVALDFRDPALKVSTDACRAYATRHRGVTQDELQPHLHHSGEEHLTLIRHASTRVANGTTLDCDRSLSI